MVDERDLARHVKGSFRRLAPVATVVPWRESDARRGDRLPTNGGWRSTGSRKQRRQWSDASGLRNAFTLYFLSLACCVTFGDKRYSAKMGS